MAFSPSSTWIITGPEIMGHEVQKGRSLPPPNAGFTARQMRHVAARSSGGASGREG
jgi:hypothetical protein